MTTAIQAQDYGLPAPRQTELAHQYKPFMERANEHLAVAQTITIEDENDVQGMKSARETRLALKKIRVEVEKTRKSLKENALREGKAIDGMANVIKYVIEPVEGELQEKEDIVRLAQARRAEARAVERAEKLHAFDFDPSFVNLREMEEEQFKSLLSQTEAGYIAKKSAEKAERERIEAERIAAEKAEAERIETERVERARMEEENRKLKEQAERDRRDREKAEKARIKAESLARKQEEERQAEARKIEQDRLDRERAELERQRKEQEELLRVEREREEAQRRAEDQARQRKESERIQAEMQTRLDAMTHKVTCPKCGHVFDAGE